MWLSFLMTTIVRILVGAYPRWSGCEPDERRRIYYANHTSHLDTVALWAALPAHLRRRTRPVAAMDYWGRNALVRFIAQRGFNAVLVKRRPEIHGGDPLGPLADALEANQSLIIFPEGTRRADSTPGPFKGGLHHLAERFPDAELIPTYLENLHRSMPKGSLLPLPFACTVHFGRPLPRVPGERKADFLERARSALMETA